MLITSTSSFFYSALVRLLQECAESETCSNKFLDLNMKVTIAFVRVWKKQKVFRMKIKLFLSFATKISVRI